MIRNYILAAYVLAVLLLSALARAGEAPITSFEYDSSRYLIHLAGVFANPCQFSPAIRVTPTAEQNVWAVSVDAKSDSRRVCAQVISGRYDLIADVRTLALPLNQNLVLVVKSSMLNPSTLKSVAIGAYSSQVQPQSLALSGRLLSIGTLAIKNKGPGFGLVTYDGRPVILETAIDLSAYVDREVEITAIPLNEEVLPSPVDDGLTVGTKTNKKKLTVFVSAISSAPLQNAKLEAQ